MIKGVKSICFNFRNTCLWFSWVSSSEMVKLNLHELQQIAVEIGTKISGLHVIFHSLLWWLICRLDLFATYRWIKKAQITITATIAVIGKYWASLSSASVHKWEILVLVVLSSQARNRVIYTRKMCRGLHKPRLTWDANLPHKRYIFPSSRLTQATDNISCGLCNTRVLGLDKPQLI